ncbi:putative beta-glucosidase A [Cytospora mali]|uniref:beta-glucosidase n=1 Tax=Cytospora mali TaxID=578113 RepID=A0A194VIB0_CYTMA|nr:putative beta-glucosidase A [Valsa mali]
MGEEHYGKGSDMQLGPVAGPLGRAPESGRNWEGFSPDPVLTGQMFAESIKGIQSSGVMTSAKHFIAYEQEHFRQTGDAAQYGFNTSECGSANLDDVTMHELYLWPFADGVKAGATSIMCSYNQVNNSQACQNSYTLNYLLKGELGFQGFVVSDWIGTHAGVSSILAGLDMTMPGDIENDSGTSFFGANLTIAVLNGTVPQWRIDDMAVRIMAGFFYVDLPIERDPITFSSWTSDTYGPEHYYVGQGATVKLNDHIDVTGNHSTLIRELGAASTVLLKNTNGALPLKGTEQLTAVFGEDASPAPLGPNGCEDRACSNGTLAMAWGSGSANFPYLVTPDTAIQNYVLAQGGKYESVFDNWDLETAAALARRAQGVNGPAVVFVNSNSGEGYLEVDSNLGDRNNLTLWENGDALITAVAAECNNTIVVVHSVGTVILEDHAENPNVTAILWAGIPGQESGNAIVDILYGKVNPGAKLPFTIGANRTHFGTDVLYTPNDLVPQMSFEEGVFIDYRAFDKKNITPTYEFGYGLSYTTFKYSNLQITKHTDAPAYTPFTGYSTKAKTYGNYSTDVEDYVFPDYITDRISLYIYPWLNSTNLSEASADPDYALPGFVPEGSQDGSSQPVPKAGGAPGGNPRLYDVLYTITASVTNTGSVAGDEIAQLYISRGGPYDPVRELRGFERLRSIQPNETRTFTVDVTRRDISSWSPEEQDWFVSNTTKPIYVGRSSRDLPLSGTLA